MPAENLLTLAVTDVRCEARDVLWIELKDPRGAALPPFAPGSHLAVTLSDGVVRHYSLCNSARERNRYCLAVGLAAQSRGGSRLIHRELRAGSTLLCSAPRNNFQLDTHASRFVFVAGGIGITPILSMIDTCDRLGRRWKLHYAARSRQRMAFYETLREAYPDACHFHFDDEAGENFNATSALESMPPDAAIYCCGPSPLMKAVEAFAHEHAPGRAHFEWFTAEPASSGQQNAEFTVVLRSSQRRLVIPSHLSILDVLEAHGEGVPTSCREGLCGTCKTGVVRGVPDHRDHVLSEDERASNTQIALCVSRAKSEELELDL